MSLRGKFIREKQRFEARLDEREPLLNKFYAKLGDGEGNLYPDEDDETYVFIRRSGRGRVEKCRNTRVIARHGLDVTVGFAPERPSEMQVLDRDDAATGWSSGGYSYVKNHHLQHELFNERGGDDAVWVYTQQFLYMLVQPTDPVSEFLMVRSGIYSFEGARRVFIGGQTIDLTVYDTGGAGDACMVLISIVAATGQLTYDASPLFSTSLPEDSRWAMVPDSESGTIPLAAVYVPHGVTSFNWFIGGSRYIFDWRVFIGVVGQGDGHNILSGTHLDTCTDTIVRGDMFIGDAGPISPQMVRVAAGGVHFIWKMDDAGEDPGWDAFDWDDISLAAGADMVHDHSAGAEGGQLDWDTVWGDAVHDHSNAAEGGNLVMGTTDTDATPGSVFFAGAGGVLQEDNANLFWDNVNKRYGIGTALPSVPFAVQSSVDLMVLIKSTDNRSGLVLADDDTDFTIGVEDDTFYIGDGSIALANASFVITDAGNVGIGTTIPLGSAQVGAVGVAGTELYVMSAGAGGSVVKLCSDYPSTGGDRDAWLAFGTNFGGAGSTPSVSWSLGIDDNNGDRLKIDYVTAAWATPGAGTVIAMDTSGAVYINDTSNANMTIGLTINQGGADDEVFAAKSSDDVAHGMTALAETDTYHTLSKRAATSGGVYSVGYTSSYLAYEIQGYFTSDLTAKDSSVGSAVLIFAAKKSGTSYGNVSAGQNVLGIRCYTGGAVRNLAIFAEDGDLYLDTVVNENHWDDYDDVALLHGLRASMAPDGSELQRRFGQWIDYARPVLERTGVVTYNDDGHHFVAVKKLQWLTIDAVRQLYEKCQRYERALLDAGLLTEVI